MRKNFEKRIARAQDLERELKEERLPDPDTLPAEGEQGKDTQKKKKKKKKKRTQSTNRTVTFILLFVLVICAVLVILTVMLNANYQDNLREQASVTAERYTLSDLELLSQKIADGISLAKQMAGRLEGIETIDEVSAAIRSIQRNNDFSSVGFCRFFSRGTEYTTYGSPYGSEREAVSKMNGTNIARCCGLVADLEWTTNAIAFYAPVSSGIADGLVLFFPADEFSRFTEKTNADAAKLAMISVFASGEGETLAILHADDGIEFHVHNNIYSLLTNLINDKTVMDNLQNDLVAERSSSYKVTVYSSDYVVSLGTPVSGGGLSFLSLYSVDRLVGSSVSLIDVALGVLVAVISLTFLAGIFVIVSRRIAERKRREESFRNQELDCPTRVAFLRTADEIIERNPNTRFAVIAMEIRHFAYIQDYFGADTATDALKFITVIVSRMLQVDETYAYDTDGRFLLLLHNRDRDSMIPRLNHIASQAYGHQDKLPDRYHLELGGGVFETTQGDYDSVEKMIENALEARNASGVEEIGGFKYFDFKMRESHMQAADIEIRMDSALANKEFVIVFQPKYNIRLDRPDGCEVLVRWFDPEKKEYRNPGLFMPLFEANGFVAKLDHYVLELALQYVTEAIGRGEIMYPVSVNVSRVTASRPDFVKYYTEAKQRYGIRDGFITLEFTESVAYENYDMLKSLITELHAAGFKCSIDDFGSGYSSYNILKELDMDEIKLDWFFIKKGFSSERDSAILESIVNLAKKLGMKVTQEGVETQDELELLRKIGCDVVQGYHYSKPLFLVDYVNFISDSSRASRRILKN